MEGFVVNAKELGHYDVVVCGGGIAGACAAISSARRGAKTLIVERAGSLGGTLTEGFMPLILDADNKGGLVKELYEFLDAHGMTCTRKGSRVDENGKRIPGRMVDTEGCKYFFDLTSTEAGVEILFYSQISALNMEDGSIKNLLITTECGNYSVTADIYIDATGNGSVAALAGCEWECGDPHEGRPSPVSTGSCVVGLPTDDNGTVGAEGKAQRWSLLAENGFAPSSEHVCVCKLPSLSTWCISANFEYDVMPDDIHSLTRSALGGRSDAFKAAEAHRKVDGYENLYTVFTSSHVGIREGRRIFGEYRITDDDILEGRRFDDGICLVTFGVDVHKLKADDTTECSRGYRAQPYNIPYRALLPKGVENLMLAGRCISGDFYPHASYRVMGNMAATGEAAGFAAAECIKLGIGPKEFDGKLAREFMYSRGYEI